MSKKDDAAAIAVAAPALEPEAAMIADLAAGDDAAKRAARGLFSALVGAGRPYEQLPPVLKQAARFDAQALLPGGEKGAAAIEVLIAAGYDAGASARVARDLGRG